MARDARTPASERELRADEPRIPSYVMIPAERRAIDYLAFVSRFDPSWSSRTSRSRPGGSPDLKLHVSTMAPGPIELVGTREIEPDWSFALSRDRRPAARLRSSGATGSTRMDAS